ncbi:MAG: hypothetical protein J7623_15925 [Chitinophaga sp.]|uniref:hypothetical protein n=1 Tax=Chitinophaga sp. TaxID=1869181 RepID=UPI001B20EE10|nr:hypothetical protein [Chitinophaga sp.]MBO9730127.1 hypothetical protein [Chitinophaga sp.]
MKRSLFLLMMLCCIRVGAQVSMTVQLPPAGVLLKAQLWNVVLVSAYERSVNVRITMRLMDARTNQPVLTGITRDIPLTKGARQLQAGDLMPIQYEYLSPAIDRSVNGFLAAGNYLACYSLVVAGDKDGNQPGEDCIPFVSEPVSPPLLNSPAHQSELLTFLPQFTWLPPAPLNMFSDLNYEMILTEVHNGQSPEEAIQQNIPVLRVPRLKNIFVNYPSGAVQLDTANTYAWSVIARNGNLFAAQTEVWTFRVKGNGNSADREHGAYVQLRKELDGSVMNGSRSLQVGYNNETADSTIAYELISLDNSNKVVYSGKLAVRRGTNYLDVPLEKRRGLHTGQLYLFRLQNSREEYWQVKFIYTKED